MVSATALESYLDESGIHEGAHACVLAAYWGSEHQWRKFEPRWKQIIKGVNVKEFHSSEFWTSDGARRGVFADWSDAKANKFIADLLECIGNYRLYPTCFALDVSVWPKLNKDERMFLTGGRYDIRAGKWITPSAPNKPYYMPFQFCVVKPASTCKPHLAVHYFVDFNKQFKQHASELFELLKKDQTVRCRDRLGQIAMPSSLDAPGLQAADLLAYQFYQFCKLRLVRNEPIDMAELNPILRGALRNLRDTGDLRLANEAAIRKHALKNLPDHLKSDATKAWCQV